MERHEGIRKVSETENEFVQRHLEMSDLSGWLARVRRYDVGRQLDPEFHQGNSLFHLGLADMIAYMAFASLDQGLNEFSVGHQNGFALWDLKDWEYFYRKIEGEIFSGLGKIEFQRDTVIDQLMMAYYETFRTILYEMNEASVDQRYLQFHMGKPMVKPSRYEGMHLQWNLEQHFQTLGLIEAYIDPKNWYPTYKKPIYVWIEEELHYPNNLSRIITHDEATEPDWVTGFGGRLVAPYHAKLSMAQLDEMWGDLLVRKNIYESKWSDDAFRQATLQALTTRLPQGGYLVDLGGGKGDFLTQSGWSGSDKQSILFDVAYENVSEAQKRGFNTGQVDLRDGIPLPNDSMMVAVMAFVIQWLPDSVLKETLRVLKSGGSLLLNVYPNDETTATLLQRKLVAQGFKAILYTNEVKRGQSTHHGLSGEAMVIRIIEAVKS